MPSLYIYSKDTTGILVKVLSLCITLPHMDFRDYMRHEIVLVITTEQTNEKKYKPKIKYFFDSHDILFSMGL